MRSADAGFSIDGAAAPRGGSWRQMNWRGLRRVPIFALGLSLPSAAALFGLVAASWLDPKPALAAGILIFILLAFSIVPLILSLTAVQEAIETIGAQSDPGAETQAARRLSNIVGTANSLWQTALRLARGWR